jgi:hypothetical protein
MSLFKENEQILRSWEAEGRNLGPSRAIDFSHVFPDQLSADTFASEVKRQGLSVTVASVERENNPWDVTVSKVMQPTCENITNTEKQLDDLARLHRGRSDGWGFFQV